MNESECKGGCAVAAANARRQRPTHSGGTNAGLSVRDEQREVGLARREDVRAQGGDGAIAFTSARSGAIIIIIRARSALVK